jgi:hypothetical protein
MGKGAGIKIIEEVSSKKKPGKKDNACPACGAPGGRFKCKECGWCVEEMGPEYGGSTKDPVSAIMHARMSYTEMKNDIKSMREKFESLILNNKRFSELVEAMEGEVKRLRLEAGKRYVYRYDQGGWGHIDDIDRAKLHIKKKVITVTDINKQLMEIMRLLRKYKK